ncbi:MAG: hypothetical protein EPN91_00660 [Salinibacterium sp.]|nr:MAG: hypothetical protein EPN91_00660 [Salinibacterium sp.]
MSDPRDIFDLDPFDSFDAFGDDADDELDDADALSGEAQLVAGALEPDTLAGDDDYEAVEELVAEDPKDL